MHGVVGLCCVCFFFQAEDGIRDYKVTGVQTCALPICFLSEVFRNRAELPPASSCEASLRGFSEQVSAAKRTKKKRQEIRGRINRKVPQRAEMPESFHRVAGKLKSGWDAGRRRSRRGLGVNHDRRRAELKSRVKQVHVRQD